MMIKTCKMNHSANPKFLLQFDTKEEYDDLWDSLMEVRDMEDAPKDLKEAIENYLTQLDVPMSTEDLAQTLLLMLRVNQFRSYEARDLHKINDFLNLRLARKAQDISRKDEVISAQDRTLGVKNQTISMQEDTIRGYKDILKGYTTALLDSAGDVEKRAKKIQDLLEEADA